MAGVSPSLPTALQQELLCVICEKLYSTPKVLPCLHTFCQDCLEERAKEDTTFNCPVCDTRTELTLEGVEQLPENTAILDLCDRIHNQEVMPQLVLDSDEEEESEEEERKLYMFCQTHSKEKQQLYCMQCKVPSCTECLDEIHAGHRMMSLKRALDDRKVSVATFLNRGKDLMENYCSYIQGLRETEKNLHEQKQQADNSITQAYQQMIRKLTDTKESMLKDVHEKHLQNIRAIHQTRDPLLTEVYELASACEGAQQDQDQTRPDFTIREKQLVQVVREISEKVARAPTPLPTPPLTPLTPRMEEWDM
ncbi:PREDICTED: tripartite motif-containing protein 2-like [Branchiostoma belcheri]|uniref:Tripartite motif-containing protein 2-like n=1 Tax=Branchiostoma belcheri TaxID=7741 RepID=A0A6P4YQY3_BRABE|nr:PREDICTED: tripartite motif-containing protein 2-like [Branchiostoma belcheri]